MSLTVADIKTIVKRRFGDESGVQLKDSDIIASINRAQRLIVARHNGLLETVATANIVSGTQEYSYPADLLRLKMVGYKGVGDVAYNPLRKFSFNELNSYITSWDGNTSQLGTPSIFAIENSKIILFPIPQTSVTAGLKLYYHRNPVSVAIDTDVPDLPNPYHDVIVDYVLQDAYEMDGDWDAAGGKSSQINQNVDRLSDLDRDTIATYSTITTLPEDAW